MKKNIEIIKTDKETLEEIINFLKNSETERKELTEAFENMKNNVTTSLLLESDSDDASLSGGYDPYMKMEFGNLKIEVASRRVTENNREINLTPKEFDILNFLASNCGQVFTKEQIYREVWATSYCLDDSNIMAFIRKLRKKIEPDPDDPVYILTVWGIGYKFNDRL